MDSQKKKIKEKNKKVFVLLRYIIFDRQRLFLKQKKKKLGI